MAIRMAVGARAGEVRRLVLRQGLQPVLLGVALGVTGSFASARLLASVLFRVETADAFIFLSVPTVLCAVACVATLLPARRATRVDPMAVLRED
jgi:ABC-type antimicrobial peptide transport system permease subunit